MAPAPTEEIDTSMTDLSHGSGRTLPPSVAGGAPVRFSEGPTLKWPIGTNTKGTRREYHFGEVGVLANFVSEPPPTIKPNGLSIPILHLGKDDALGFGEVVQAFTLSKRHIFPV